MKNISDYFICNKFTDIYLSCINYFKQLNKVDNIKFISYDDIIISYN